MIHIIPSTFLHFIFPSQRDNVREKLCRRKQERGSLKHLTDQRGQESGGELLNTSRDMRETFCIGSFKEVSFFPVCKIMVQALKLMLDELKTYY